jgi:hypothetical protein
MVASAIGETITVQDNSLRKGVKGTSGGGGSVGGKGEGECFV